MAAVRKPRKRDAEMGFDTISFEGGLIAPEWFSRIAQARADFQSEADYRLDEGLTLRNEIPRDWSRARPHWTRFAAGLAAGADKHLLTEIFITTLFKQSFWFGSLERISHVTLQGRIYPIGFAALGGRVPLVLAPAGLGLDTQFAAFGDGHRKRSAAGLLQEYLNADDRCLWGIVTDGVKLRLLRDNASLTRPAHIEVDLGRLFTEDRFAEFTALWLLLHESRFGRPDALPTDCPLEAWRNAAREEGIRARDQLRDGVEAALLAFGNGFLHHADNGGLRDALRQGKITTKAYFQQLLRLVYRLLFLLTAEERAVLHAKGADENAKSLYQRAYSLQRLRARAVKRQAHDRFSDVWESVKIVFRGLGRGEPRLGLPALAGIFSHDACPDLDGAKVENHAVLGAMFRLSWLRTETGLARVNWRDMDVEELGSVYESLLELVPQVSNDCRNFDFAKGAETKGNARKTTGSYYTPASLVQVLLDSALEPVVAQTIAANPVHPVEALLKLAIVDPACGSGHFLLAAARRVGWHVARLSSEGTPTLDEYRHAVRQVVGRCVYGVDLNPMAVELCKVSLWMEAVEPGRPLSFLDAHVRHGNALLGTTKALMDTGIPDAAWEAIEGDDKKIATALKKKNKKATGGQRDLFAGKVETEASQVAQKVAELEAAGDAELPDIEQKQSLWRSILASPEYRHEKLVADAWCSAFVWLKIAGTNQNEAPTNDVWRQVRDKQGKPSTFLVDETAKLAEQYHFFHWELEYPQIFGRGGFDVVLGNPPWERVKLQEQEFFASRSDDIANAANAAARKKLIAELPKKNERLWEEWCAASREAEGQSHFVRQSTRYPLCGKGDVNTYALFAEHNRSVLGPKGRAGFIVPSGIVTDDTTKEYFQAIVDGNLLRSLYDFQSGPGLFGSIGHGTFKFSLVTLSGASASELPHLSFYSRSVTEALSLEKRFTLSAVDIAILNPNTRTCPIFRSRRDADINLMLYRRSGILWRDNVIDGNTWSLRFLRMLDMANDSTLFRTSVSEDHLPLIEAKMVHHFDHRFGDYRDHPEGSENLILPDVPEERLRNPEYSPIGRYWVASGEVKARLADVWSHSWFLGWRDVTKPQNERTVIASLIPRVAVGDKFLLMLPSTEPPLIAALYGNLCSFALDYCARQKVGGTSLKYFTMRQLPVLPPSTYENVTPWHTNMLLRDWILPRVLELTYTAWDLEAFGQDVGYAGPPFRWNPERRVLLRAELDAAFFHLYGISREDTDYILETFPIVRKNDEKAHGEYRTKRLILEVYDAMASAIRSGNAYATRLDPPPADPSVAHAPREKTPAS